MIGGFLLAWEQHQQQPFVPQVFLSLDRRSPRRFVEIGRRQSVQYGRLDGRANVKIVRWVFNPRAGKGFCRFFYGINLSGSGRFRLVSNFYFSERLTQSPVR